MYKKLYRHNYLELTKDGDTRVLRGTRCGALANVASPCVLSPQNCVLPMIIVVRHTTCSVILTLIHGLCRDRSSVCKTNQKQYELHKPGGAKGATNVLRRGREGASAERCYLPGRVAGLATLGDRSYFVRREASRGDRLSADLRERILQITVSDEVLRASLCNCCSVVNGRMWRRYCIVLQSLPSSRLVAHVVVVTDFAAHLYPSVSSRAGFIF